MYLNNSAIRIADIGERRRALFCRTDSVACCRSPNSAGQFYAPEGLHKESTVRGAVNIFV